MIQVEQEGHYILIETHGQTKIINFDKKITYAWISAEDLGELLIISHKHHNVDHILSMGKYRVYSVKNEPKLTDQLHLELYVGEGNWQGYLLPTGFPNDEKKRSRIIPTKELITISKPLFKI